jgi:hypothetical protein
VTGTASTATPTWPLGQFVSSVPFEAGPQLEDEEGDAEGAEVAIVQTLRRRRARRG